MPKCSKAIQRRGISGRLSAKLTPGTAISAEFRAKLLEEREEARRDSKLEARFLSHRLNVPSGDEITVLLTVDDWEWVVAREVPAPQSRPVVGVDLDGSCAWSAAVATRSNGLRGAGRRGQCAFSGDAGSGTLPPGGHIACWWKPAR